jgi:hypothetical protein
MGREPASGSSGRIQDREQPLRRGDAALSNPWTLVSCFSAGMIASIEIIS